MQFTQGQLGLSYRTFGHGPSALIAFHGFGRTGQDFSVFEQALGDIATIYAFDLPFHGESPSPSERAAKPFGPDELRDFFTAFADQLGAQKIIVIGFSLGGRIALSLLETMPQRISSAILIAPDGLKRKPWYRGLASSAWGRARYRSFIERPRRVHHITNMLKRTGLMREKMHRFIIGQTDTREKRLLLHDVWLSFRQIEPDLLGVLTNVRKHAGRLFLVFGEFDQVIKTEYGLKLARIAPDIAQVVEVPLGHQLLTPEVAERVKGLLATA